MQEFPFIGRSDELKALSDLMHKKTSSLIVLQGRRRIGKSRLIKEFGKNFRFLSFAGLAPTHQTTVQSEMNEFTRQLSVNCNYRALQSSDWGDLFSALARETTQGKVIILLDEISWMGSKSPDFLSKLKNAWDLEFKNNPELMLILCGSVSSWIDKNILSSTGFMGRLSAVFDLKELKLHECNTLLNTIGFCNSDKERLKILSVTGGVPRYIEEINHSKLADENIKDLCFKTRGILFREFGDIFSDIFAKRSDIYQAICQCLADGSKDLLNITKAIGAQKSGHLSEYLTDLVKSGFIRRDYTWNIKAKKLSKLSLYRLNDNYLRFYLKYIEPNKGLIENGNFNNKSLSTLPGFSSIMGLQFENLVLNNRDLIISALNIYPEDVLIDNPYFQTTKSTKPGCQIDYLIQTKSNILFACEIKSSTDKIGTDIIESITRKLSNLVVSRGFAVIPVLIHIGDISDALIEKNYFGRIIDFSSFLK